MIMEEFLRFIKAVRDGDFEKVKVLANEKIINNPSGDGGDTALHIATYAGYTKVVKNLLEIKGVKVDTVNKTGETALHLASSLGDRKIVEVLLKNGKANPFLVDNDGKSALQIATQNGNKNVVKVIMEKTNEIDENSKSEVRQILWKPEIFNSSEVLSGSCFLPISCENLKEVNVKSEIIMPIPRGRMSESAMFSNQVKKSESMFLRSQLSAFL